MVLLRPVEDGVEYILGAHAPLRGQIVAAAGAVGEGSVRLVPVVIPRHSPPQPGVLPVGVVVHNVHNHPEAVAVQRLDGLLHFPDPHRAVGGVGGIGALRNIVVDRVVAPVELLRTAAFIHRAVIKNRHQLDMGHAQLPEVGKAGRPAAVSVQSGVFQAERLELSPVLGGNPGRRVPGEILDMDFIDHCFRRKRRRFVPGPALRVGRRPYFGRR